jgi:hypothetical protein
MLHDGVLFHGVRKIMGYVILVECITFISIHVNLHLKPEVKANTFDPVITTSVFATPHL